mmetsp:Transcript_19747/g.55527  ORF Transcript_19747/g.55527 Transcript_19747/m.55527 type:complete len:255 (+) Transcript_19747:325-1089(+)
MRAGVAVGVAGHVETAAHLQAHPLVEDPAGLGLAASEGGRPHRVLAVRQVSAPLVAELAQELLVVCADIAVVGVHAPLQGVLPIHQFLECCHPHCRRVRRVPLHRRQELDVPLDLLLQVRPRLPQHREQALEAGLHHGAGRAQRAVNDIRHALAALRVQLQVHRRLHGAPGGVGTAVTGTQGREGHHAGEPERAEEAASSQAPAETAAAGPAGSRRRVLVCVDVLSVQEHLELTVLRDLLHGDHPWRRGHGHWD